MIYVMEKKCSLTYVYVITRKKRILDMLIMRKCSGDVSNELLETTRARMDTSIMQDLMR